MPRKRHDIGNMLVSQIGVMAGPNARIALKKEKPWASITFSGTCHYLTISPTGENGAQSARKLIKRLPEQAFDLPGHFVADLLIRDHQPGDQEIAIEILTIIDPVARPET